jgi:hypothetical protein
VLGVGEEWGGRGRDVIGVGWWCMWLFGGVGVSVGLARTDKQRVAEIDVRYIQLSDRARSAKTLVDPKPLSSAYSTSPAPPRTRLNERTDLHTCPCRVRERPYSLR